MADTQRIAYQPLHPSVIPSLDERYVKVHNEIFRFLRPVTEWNPDLRTAPSKFESTTSEPVDVGSIRPFDLGNEPDKYPVLVYTPKGAPPAAGWPALLGMHGGMVFPFYDPMSPSQRLK
jgi:acetyl esterase/lipase